MIKVNGKFELADLKAAQALHARSGRLVTWLGYVMLGVMLLIFIGGIVLALLGSLPWLTALIPAFILGFLALFQFYLKPYQITRSYDQHKELSSPFELELTDEGYSITNSYGSGKIPWKDFAKWKEDQKVILLYRTDNMFNMVPRRLLQEAAQIQYIHEQLRRNNVKEASRVRNPVRMVLWGLVVILLLLVVIINVYMIIQNVR
jgi:hypothetical protein